jgi:rRNA biogenesis protein RRP5
LIITLGQNVTAYVSKTEMDSMDAQLKDGDIVRVRVATVSHKDNKMKVQIIGREFSGPREMDRVVIKRKRTESENEETEIKRLLKQEIGNPDSSSQSNLVLGSGIMERLKVLSYGKKKKAEENEESGKRLNLFSGFSFNSQKESDTGDKAAEVSDESEDEDKVGTTKLKMVASKIEEQQLYEQEKAMMAGDYIPDSIDAFDRLVLASPNSSMIWLQYMAFHLKSAEVDKARAVAQRALETINYREESEKLNVWVALLNLENMYGSPDNLNNTFQKALQFNDQIKVYRSMASIYEKSSKLRHAEEMHKVMSKKFKFDPEVWINFGSFYMRTHQCDQARNLLQRCSQVLTKKEYVYIVTRYADMEYRYGDPDRGRNMFETLLSNFPKRTDIWLVYIDKLLKSGNVEGARWVCERAVTLRLAPRKIRILFKKYIEVERRFGTANTVEAVQKKAVQYVQEVIESQK